MNRFTVLFSVLFLSLACASSGYSELAEEECTPAADATACDKCFLEACATQCKECVDNETCYACTSEDSVDDEACKNNQEVALLLTCVLGSSADCMDECAGAPPPDPAKPPRIGKGRKSKGGGGGGGGEGKAGKGGKHKGG